MSDTKRSTDLPLERSDDPSRGSMPHLQRVIQQVRCTLGPGNATPCYRCRARAVSLIDTTAAPRAVCADHAAEWRTLSPVQREQARIDFARRSIQ